MRIAYMGIKGLPAQFGADRVVEAITQRLSTRHEISVYCSARYTPPAVSVSRVNLIRLPYLPGKRNHMASVDFLAAWHAVLRGNYDCIHLHNIEASLVLPILRLRYPVVVTAHGRTAAGSGLGTLAEALAGSLEMPYSYLANAATSVSLCDAEQISARYHRKIYYIPNGVETRPEVNTDSAQGILHTLGANAGQYILFAAGRILPLKGAHLLLDAYTQLTSDVRLVITADLSQFPKYTRQLVAAADGRVLFQSFIPSNSTLLGLVQLARLFVFPSTYEAMSMMLLEAASVGTPIVCSDIPANTAVLGEYALYFRSGDAADLAEKLQWALDHLPAMAKLGACAEAHVKGSFAWDAIAGQYEKLYKHVVTWRDRPTTRPTILG